MILSLRSRSFARDPFKEKWFTLIFNAEKSFEMRGSSLNTRVLCLRLGTKMN